MLPTFRGAPLSRVPHPRFFEGEEVFLCCFLLTTRSLLCHITPVKQCASLPARLFYFQLNFRSHLCPLFAHRTANPCVVSPSPMPANAALPAPPITPTSAPTTPARTPGAPPINSHPERSEVSQPIPATPFALSNAPSS